MSQAYAARRASSVWPVWMQPTVMPEQLVDRRHPLGVAVGEVVVDRDDVHALALQGVEERRQGGDEGLALARLHLGDAAEVDRRAADELDVVMPLLDRPLGRLADQGERLDEQAVERVALPRLEPQRVAPRARAGRRSRARAPAPGR